MNNAIPPNIPTKFNFKSGCLGMLAIMVAVILMMCGFILVLGQDIGTRTGGFIMFVAGSVGFISFFVFAVNADGVIEYIKRFFIQR